MKGALSPTDDGRLVLRLERGFAHGLDVLGEHLAGDPPRASARDRAEARQPGYLD